MTASQRRDGDLMELLGKVRRKGVRLWPENGRLRYRAPKDALSPQELETLRRASPEIVAFLQKASSPQRVMPLCSVRAREDLAPLTFSQLAHWSAFQLADRPSIRQIATAMHLRGGLDLAALRKAIHLVVQRQDALRTRVIVHDGVPMQEISASYVCEIESVDLSALPEEQRDQEIRRQIDEHILRPIDVSLDPLFGIRLLKLSRDEHVLIAAMEHMISDMYSMSIWWAELFEAYRQACSGRLSGLPPVPIRYADYAQWQQSSHHTWREKNDAYWRYLVSSYEPLAFPTRAELGTERGWGAVPLRIEKDLREVMQRWCQQRGTTLPLACFAAYAAVTLRWGRQAESIIRYQTDGRTSQELKRTIGFFAAPVYVRVGLRPDDTFITFLERVIEDYCTACEHADSFYLASRAPRPDVTRSCLFNWIPQRQTLDISRGINNGTGLSASAIRFEHPMLRTLALDMEPSVVFVDADEAIVADLYFQRRKIAPETMERFARDLLLTIETMIREPQREIQSIETGP